MRRPLAIVGGMIGALLLAGCGVTSHVQATQNRKSTHRTSTTSMHWITNHLTSATVAKLEVPATWQSYHVFVGDTGGTEWVNPNDPAERVDVVSTGCVGCMQNAQGQWDVRSLFGTPSVHWTSVSTNHKEGHFTNTSHSDPFVANGDPANPAHGHSHDPYIAQGVAQIVPNPTILAVEVEAWAPASLASSIIDSVSVQTSSALTSPQTGQTLSLSNQHGFQLDATLPTTGWSMYNAAGGLPNDSLSQTPQVGISQANNPTSGSYVLGVAYGTSVGSGLGILNPQQENVNSQVQWHIVSSRTITALGGQATQVKLQGDSNGEPFNQAVVTYRKVNGLYYFVRGATTSTSSQFGTVYDALVRGFHISAN